MGGYPYNKVILIGKVMRDPELRYTASGSAARGLFSGAPSVRRVYKEDLPL
jgi:single-stranded DNA-binding protein